MNLKKHPALFFVFTALLVTVCRCQPDVFGSNSEGSRFSDGSPAMSCKLFSEIFEPAEEGGEPVINSVWECAVTCPDNSQVNFDLYTQPAHTIPLAEKTEFLARSDGGSKYSRCTN